MLKFHIYFQIDSNLWEKHQKKVFGVFNNRKIRDLKSNFNFLQLKES